MDLSLPEVATYSDEDYLVKHKGMSPQQVKGMLENVTQSAKDVGLEYNFDKSILVNSLSAHKFMQFAKTKGLGDQAEEILFLAFFTEGKNLADMATLVQLGREIGLDETEVKTAFTDEKYASLVNQDIQEAQQIGVQGVPFFVLDRKYGVSGAQPAEAFSKNLEIAFAKWRKLNPHRTLLINFLSTLQTHLRFYITRDSKEENSEQKTSKTNLELMRLKPNPLFLFTLG